MDTVIVTVAVGVYVEEGSDRDALTEALARENYLPVYLDPRTVFITLLMLLLIITLISAVINIMTSLVAVSQP